MVLYNLTEYQTEFRVKLAVWNPVLDLLALASDDGEVLVDRLYSKKACQLKVKQLDEAVISEEQVHPDKAASVTALGWSPNGHILVIASGWSNLHLIDVDTAERLHSIGSIGNVTLMSWCYTAGPEKGRLTHLIPMTNNLPEIDNGSKRSRPNTYSDLLLNGMDLRDSVLFATTEDGHLLFFMAGVLLIFNVDLVALSGDQIQTINALNYMEERNSLAIAYTHSRTPTEPIIVQIAVVDLRLNEAQLLPAHLSDLTLRWAKLTRLTCYLKAAYEKLGLCWIDISQDLDPLFKDYANSRAIIDRSTVGEDMLTMLLLGHISMEMEAFLVHKLGEKKLKKLIDAMERSNKDVGKLLSSNLSSAADLLLHNLVQLTHDLKQSLQSMDGTWNEAENLVSDFKFASKHLSIKLAETKTVSAICRRQLTALLRWLEVSLQLAVASNSDRERNAVAENDPGSMVDSDFLVQFILETFYDKPENVTPAETASSSNIRQIFHLEKVRQYLRPGPLSVPLDLQDNGWDRTFKEFLSVGLGSDGEEGIDLESSSLDDAIKGTLKIVEKFERFLVKSFANAVVVGSTWRPLGDVEKSVNSGKNGCPVQFFEYNDANCQSNSDKSPRRRYSTPTKDRRLLPFEFPKESLAVAIVSHGGNALHVYSIDGTRLWTVEFAQHGCTIVDLSHLWGGQFYAIVRDYQTNGCSMLRLSVEKNAQLPDKENWRPLADDDSFSTVIVSGQRRMGIALDECGMRMRWFETEPSMGDVSM